MSSIQRRSAWLFAGFAPFTAWIAVQGCGGDASSTDAGPDGTMTTDSGGGMDGTGPPDSNTDDGSVDAGSDSPSGTDSGGVAYLCPDAGTVISCSQCANRPRPCVNCAVDGGALVAYCVTLGTSCFPGNNSPLRRCPCGDAGNCPAPYQVCHDVGGFACRTCGETNTLGDSCNGGGMCRADGGCN